MKFTVSEDTEITLNGQKYLLEAGDILEYVHGPRYNEVKQTVDTDTKEFIEEYIKENPGSDVVVSTLLKLFIHEHPDYVSGNDRFFGTFNEDEITNAVKKSIKTNLRLMGVRYYDRPPRVEANPVRRLVKKKKLKPF